MTATPAPPVASAEDHPLRAAETCWPIAGTAEYLRLSPVWRASRADRLRDELQRHVIETWFPRSVDTAGGGFLCDFDGQWRPLGSQVRMLEFQARQTRTCARLGQAFPQHARWREWTEHGVRFLNETMHDQQYGGWFWLLDHDGTIQAGGTKHAHSTAYLISTYVEAYRLTHDPALLERAKEAFRWLDATLHDKIHGGYRTWATRDGQPIMRPEDVDPSVGPLDPLGHDVGLKDANVHSDLLDSLRLLYAEWRDDVVRDRLSELYTLFIERHSRPDGSVHYVLTDDLQPVPGPEHYGYPPQAGSRMVRVALLIGRPLADAFAWERTGLDHILEAGRHPDGGILSESAPSRPLRPWWVQIEVLQGMVLLAAQQPDGEVIAREFDELSSFVERDFLDARHGGWHPRARGDWPLAARVRPSRVRKGDRWKDASHEADFYLTAIRVLRGLPSESPLETQPS